MHDIRAAEDADVHALVIAVAQPSRIAGARDLRHAGGADEHEAEVDQRWTERVDLRLGRPRHVSGMLEDAQMAQQAPLGYLQPAPRQFRPSGISPASPIAARISSARSSAPIRYWVSSDVSHSGTWFRTRPTPNTRPGADVKGETRGAFRVTEPLPVRDVRHTRFRADAVIGGAPSRGAGRRSGPSPGWGGLVCEARRLDASTQRGSRHP